MKFQHAIALVALTLFAAPGAHAAVLAGPLTNAASGHAYYLLDADTWTASEAEARSLGGHLVTGHGTSRMLARPMPHLSVAWIVLALSLGGATRLGAADALVWRAKEIRVDADIEAWPLPRVLQAITSATGWQVYVEPGAAARIGNRQRPEDRVPDRHNYGWQRGRGHHDVRQIGRREPGCTYQRSAQAHSAPADSVRDPVQPDLEFLAHLGGQPH